MNGATQTIDSTNKTERAIHGTLDSLVGLWRQHVRNCQGVGVKPWDFWTWMKQRGTEPNSILALPSDERN